jgi:hypothetical protein
MLSENQNSWYLSLFERSDPPAPREWGGRREDCGSELVQLTEKAQSVEEKSF